MALYNLFDSAPFASTPASYAGNFTIGTEFYVTATGWVTQIRYAHHTANVGNMTPRTCAIYSTVDGNTGTMVAGPFTMPAPVRGQWCVLDLPTPFQLTPNTRYRVGVLFPGVGGNASWLSTMGYFNAQAQRTTGILVRPNTATSVNAAQGSWAPGASITFPYLAEGGEASYVDVTVSDVDPSAPPPGSPYSVRLPGGTEVPATIEGVAMLNGALLPAGLSTAT